MEEIKLYNRDHESYSLSSLEKNKYELKGPLKYLRLGLIQGYPTSYSFIDPSGGPYIALNHTIPGIKGKVVSIDKEKGKYILTFK